MADPTMSQLAFDPAPMGPPQSFSPTPPAPGVQPDASSPQWQQIMQAAQRGQISQAQLQQLAQRLGYQLPQQQQQQGTQNQNVGAQLGDAAGQIAGRAVQAMNNFTKPPAAAQGNPAPPVGATPSPAWGQ